MCGILSGWFSPAPTYTYDVWINGTLVAQNLQTYWPHGELVDSIILHAYTGLNVFFDNVRVFAAFSTTGEIQSSFLLGATASRECSSPDNLA